MADVVRGIDVYVIAAPFVEVKMTYDEAVALAALSAHIGGDPDDSPRGTVCDILNSIRSTLDPQDVRRVARNIEGTVRYSDC